MKYLGLLLISATLHGMETAPEEKVLPQYPIIYIQSHKNKFCALQQKDRYSFNYAEEKEKMATLLVHDAPIKTLCINLTPEFTDSFITFNTIRDYCTADYRYPVIKVADFCSKRNSAKPLINSLILSNLQTIILHNFKERDEDFIRTFVGTITEINIECSKITIKTDKEESFNTDEI
jgi:hypothetical protein